jgi:hypothetical protein
MLLTARRLFAGATTGLVEDQVLEIEDGGIVAICPRDRVPASADLVDLGDVTLLPGLIDVHQHLAFDASADPVAQLDADDDATLLLRMRRAAQRALVVGITTIRDLGDRNYLSLALRDWFLSGGEVGPRIVASGPPITTPNGHCWFLGGEADGPDGSAPRCGSGSLAESTWSRSWPAAGIRARPSAPTSPSWGGPSWPSPSRRRTPPACRWRCTPTASTPCSTPSPSAPTRSNTALSSPPTASAPPASPASCPRSG